MKTLTGVIALMLALMFNASSVGVGSMAWAAINLNSSKSNVYRVVYDGMTPGQAAAVLAEFDKVHPDNEAKVRQILQKLFVPTNFKLIVVQPAAGMSKLSTIILLTRPEQLGEAQALAVSDEGVGPVKKSAK